MNYTDLATHLLDLGERLQKHSRKIEGDKVGQSAKKLVQAVERFEDTLDSFLASRKSGELLLETMLRSPSAKRHLTVELLKRGLREVAGKRLQADELSAARKEFVEVLHANAKGSQGGKFLQAAFEEAACVEPGGKDKASIQREFVRLGGLSDEEYEKEIGKRTLGELRRLASTNGIKFTDKASKQRLMALIRRFSSRAAVNISFDE
jgi:hypothetical protein